MSKDVSTKFYQDNIKKLQKKLEKDTKKEKRKKATIYSSKTQTSLRKCMAKN